MKKIFYITDVKLNKNNATSIHVKEIIKNFIRDGNQVVLFMPYTKDNINLNCQMKYIKYFNKGFLFNLTFQILLFFQMIKMYLIDKPDIIYVRKSASMITPPVFSYIFNIPQIFEVNGILKEEVKILHNFNFFINYVLFFIEKINFIISNKIITVTSNIKKNIINNYNISPNKIYVISNGANTNMFKKLPKKYVFNKINLDEKYRYIGFVGNLVYWQGVDLLIESANYLINNCDVDKIKFLIVGNGKEYSKLKKLTIKYNIDSYFVFTGEVPYEQVVYYINACQLMIALKRPLKSGYSPLKLYEYLACEKPVIATSVNGFEIIEEKKLGLLVNPNNNIEIAKSIKFLLDHPAICKRMGKRGRAVITENHSWQNISEKILELIIEE